MQIKRSSVLVDDQEKALRFYTTVLGFVKDKHIPMGPFRWLTVNSPEGARCGTGSGADEFSAGADLAKSIDCRWHPGHRFPHRRYSG
jgi:catechol 2,3-dioxygenase-like lactoylglutathione lyase family enzyme